MEVMRAVEQIKVCDETDLLEISAFSEANDLPPTIKRSQISPMVLQGHDSFEFLASPLSKSRSLSVGHISETCHEVTDLIGFSALDFERLVSSNYRTSTPINEEEESACSKDWESKGGQSV